MSSLVKSLVHKSVLPIGASRTRMHAGGTLPRANHQLGVCRRNAHGNAAARPADNRTLPYL